MQRGKASRRRYIDVGLVGLGNHAQDCLLPWLKSFGDVRLGYLLSRDITKAKQWQKEFGAIRVSNDWEAVLRSHSVDCIIACGTPDLHQAVATLAICERIPVFVEKPCATSLRQVRALETLAKKQPTIQTFVGHNFRFSAGYRALHELIRSLGDAKIMRVKFLASKPRRKLWSCKSVVESSLLAVGIHAIDITTHMMGAPDSVRASYCAVGGDTFALSVVFRYDSGKMATIELGNYSNRFETVIEVVVPPAVQLSLTDLVRLEVSGDVSRSASEPPLLGAKQRVLVERSPISDDYLRSGYRTELRHFFDAIVNNRSTESPIESAVLVHELIEKIMEQIKRPN